MCILTYSTLTNSLFTTLSMHSSNQSTSSDGRQQQQQQDSPSEVDETRTARASTPSSLTGTRSDLDSPFRSYAVIETDPNELDRIIDLLRQFFPNTRVLECNNPLSTSIPSRTPSRSSLATAPQQQTSTESSSSLRVPLSTGRYRSNSHSTSEKFSFESDILQNLTTTRPHVDRHSISETLSTATSPSDQSSSNTNSQAFKGKVKDYLQRRYLEQLGEHQSRKETFTKCRSDDLNYSRTFKIQPNSALVQSFELISSQQTLQPYRAGCLHSSPSPLLTSNTTAKTRSLDLQHSVSDTNLYCAMSAATNNDLINSSESTSGIVRSQSKRGLLQRCATIDMEDTPASNEDDDDQMTSSPTSPPIIDKNKSIGVGGITFSIDRPDDDDDEEAEEEDVRSPSTISSTSRSKSRPFQHSLPVQRSTSPIRAATTTDHSSFLLPFRHSLEQQHGKRNLPPSIATMTFNTSVGSHVPPPLTPYSASSDPGPHHSPWARTPTNPYGLVNFRFPKSQEHLVASAQGSMAQLSTLTKILCDDSSVFTPITPRFKTEAQEPSTSRDSSSSVPPCQVCRQQFDSRQTYLAHYRTHLESNLSEDDKTGIVDLATDTGDRLGSELRHYSCKICSKRFSRSDMLNRHLRLHSGIRPYRCLMCNTHFSRSDHLSTHLRTHTGEKPYACPECSYAACRRDMITRHLKVHTKQRSERKNATSSMGSSNES